MMENMKEFDLDIRYFIYQTFSKTAKPPTTIEVAEQLKAPISEIEKSLDRLAAGHQIALAPGSHSIWMAHPFSGIPTNFAVEVNGKKYRGN